MKFFDSLTHVTRDGSWLGERTFDASLGRLLREMDEAGAARACLVGIADYTDNDVILECVKAHSGRFAPVAGVNPRTLPTERRVEAVVGKLAEQGFAGIKLHPRLNGYDPLDPKGLAAIDAAGRNGLVVFLDTLFRQRGLPTRNAPDTIDFLAGACPDTRIVLLHAAGPSMLELFETVRMYPNLRLDFSFTIMRYAGSRLDEDMRFLFRTTDQLITLGSDFPEYTPKQVLARFAALAKDLDPHRAENILHGNLERLFADYFDRA